MQQVHLANYKTLMLPNVRLCPPRLHRVLLEISARIIMRQVVRRH
jgi:hypothetical protein